MRKVYSMILAAVLSVLFVGNVNAGDRIPFTAENFTFYNYDGWGADANRVEAINGNFLIDQADGCPIGDTSCNAWVDLENYSKMYVTMEGCDADGVPNGSNPRIFINRSAENGQFNADKSQSACLVIPNGGWAAEYYSDLGNGTYEIDLEKILKDFGVVHFHSIKGSSWNTKAIVHSIEVEEKSGEKTGWISLISNGNLEGSDVTSFKVAFDAVNNAGYQDVEILDGVGVDGSRGIKISTIDTATEDWATQFFVALNEWIPEGTQYRMSFDYKASVDMEKAVGSGAHGEPRAWQGAPFFDPPITFASEWQHYTIDSATLPANLAGSKGLGSIAFDLNVVRDQVIDFYFDNFILEYYKLRDPKDEFAYTYKADAFGINLADNTNMKDLVKAAGGETLIFPNDCAKVTWDGKDCGILSVEGRPDGNLYIFIKDIDGNEDADWDKPAKEVKISFTNPTDPAFQVLYTRGQFDGQVMPDLVDEVCTWDEKWDDDIYSYLWGAPVLVSADPENGSFNLDPALKQFTLKFNQDVDASTVVAKLGRETLTATAGETEDVVILTRTGSNALSGTTEIHIDNVESVKGMPIDDPIILKISFGPVVIDENDQPETLYASNFTNDGDDAQGAGWIVTADINEQHPDPSMQPANSGGGNRLQHGLAGYAADVLYLAQRSARAGIALYGTEDDHKLTLKGGKTYHLTLKTAQWDAYPAAGSNRSLRVQVLTEDAVSTDDGTIIDENGIIAEDFKATNGRVKEDKEYTAFDIAFTPEADGNYVIRLVAGNSDGNPAGYNDGNAIADVKVEYIPDVMGIVETQALELSLKTAKETLEANQDERYDGAVYTALDNLIKEYDGKTLTAPSAFAKANDDLAAAVKAMNDHHSKCDNFDATNTSLQSLVAQYEVTKYESTEQFAQLKAVAEKYVGQVLKDDAALDEALAEMKPVSDLCALFFTEGQSNDTDAGIKVLVERIRLGAEALKVLGAAEDDELILAANEAMTDDDELADRIKKQITLKLYEGLKDPENTLFEESVELDDEGNEVITSTQYDMSVFIKNPNMYALHPADGINPENTPGWERLNGNMGLYGGGGASWGTPRNIDGLPEDCAFTIYQANTRAEQTITDLPAGRYIVSMIGTDWGNKRGDDLTGPDAQGFVYCKTSDTPVPEEGEEENRDTHFAATKTIEYAGQWRMDKPHDMEVTVVDGQLTIGMQFASDSQYFIGNVRLYMNGPADGFNYVEAYENILAGVDAAKVAPQVRAIEVYDLNGRRITKATKGLNILKKVMSDGSIKTEKVVR